MLQEKTESFVGIPLNSLPKSYLIDHSSWRPCKRCGSQDRYAWGNCIPCSHAKNKINHAARSLALKSVVKPPKLNLVQGVGIYIFRGCMFPQ